MSFVAILMGSSSDADTMAKAASALDDFGIENESKVLSAHRQPEALVDYIRSAEERGVSVYICGAGMAAALPGVVAAHTAKPVIGVPLESGGLGGLDALLAVVQMPKGVPVACVAVNGAQNAGLLAAQMIALTDAKVATAYAGYKKALAKP